MMNKAQTNNDSFSSDEPNVEIAEIEELHSSASSYVLNPKLKASAVNSLPVSEPNDTMIHEGPYETDMAVSVVQIQGGNKILNGRQTIEESPVGNSKKSKDRHERTAKKGFKSGNNPHDLVRCAQKEKYVWYATYDEEMQAEKFMEVLNSCNDKCAPIEVKGVQIEGYEVTFMQTNEREGYGRFKATIKGNRYSSAFMRAYLIKRLQFNNVVLLKNKVAHGSVILTMDKLKSSRGCQSVILNECSPEGAIIKLGEHDRIPMYTIAMPPLFPYKVTAPDTRYLKRMLIGLLEAFPSYSQDFFMYYLYTKEGVQDHYTISQLAQIVLKQNEKPVSGGNIKRYSNGLCDNSSDSSSSPDKENIRSRANHPFSKKTHASPPGSLSIEKSLSYITPMLSRTQAIPLAKQHPLPAEKPNEIVPSVSNGVFVVDRMKANLLQQIEAEGFAPCLKTHPLLFSSEERSESLNDEDYEYTQLNTSTMKELSDLDKESVADGFGTGKRQMMAQTEAATMEGRASCLIANDLYCPENISEVFKSRSFAIQD